MRVSEQQDILGVGDGLTGEKHDTYTTYMLPVRNVNAYGEAPINLRSEMLEMEKSWADLDRESQEVNTEVKHMMRGSNTPFIYAAEDPNKDVVFKPVEESK